MPSKIESHHVWISWCSLGSILWPVGADENPLKMQVFSEEGIPALYRGISMERVWVGLGMGVKAGVL